MPAYFDTGFSVREPMWHGGGLVLDDYPSDWNDARTKAGLLWEPAVRPAYVQVPVLDPTESVPEGWLAVADAADPTWMQPLPDTYLGRTLLRPEPLKARAVALAREVAR